MAKAQSKDVSIQNYLIVKKAQPLVVENAKLGLEIQNELTQLTEEFDEIKTFFRDHADGEQFNFTVPGAGSVQVKAPAAASSGTSVTFNELEFNLLPAATRKLLVEKGVVSITSWSRPASKAAVVFTLNK